MEALTFDEARNKVIGTVLVGAAGRGGAETVTLADAAWRVLAEDLTADRDYPPTARSVRDGYAIQAADLPGTLRVIGEVRAGGEPFAGAVGPGEAVAIMTGAPMPAGADAVVMVEHVEQAGEGLIRSTRELHPGENFNPRASEAREGATVIPAGTRLDYTGVGLAATYGRETLRVHRRPRVAILATGDEVVPVGSTPAAHQVRNSNSWALAAQVARAGGLPVILDVARDEMASTRERITEGFARADLLLVTGGVSAGKYDLVEPVLEELGAVFHFTRVKIQPGQPLVFGEAGGKYFFGLPGNPASAMVTFELFARAALDLLSGVSAPVLPLAWAKLTKPLRHRAGLTRFLPAFLEHGELTPVPWAGSSDVAAMSRSNAYLVADPDHPEYAAGDWIRVLLK